MNVKIGKYDRQVILYAPTAYQSSETGITTVIYNTVRTIWGYVNQRANNSQFDTSKRVDSNQVTIDVRYNDADDIIDTWQFTYEGLRYAVTSVNEAMEYNRKSVIRIVGKAIK
jgi:SPP1 family predicted phage head-tail adaptor